MRRKGKRKNYKPLFILIYALLFSLFIFFVVQLFPIVNRIIHPDSREELIAPYTRHNSAEDFELLLRQKKIAYDSLKLSSDSAVLTVQISKGPKVFFSTYEDAPWQVTSLQTILSRLAIDKVAGQKKNPRTIDMRFSKPIVKF